LNINAKKTKLMRINNKGQRPIEVNGIYIDVEEFTYLGATVSTNGGETEDISAGLNKGTQTFRRLNKTWNSSVYSKRTKIKLFNSLVQPVVLFGSQTWKMTEGDNKKMCSNPSAFAGFTRYTGHTSSPTMNC